MTSPGSRTQRTQYLVALVASGAFVAGLSGLWLYFALAARGTTGATALACGPAGQVAAAIGDVVYVDSPDSAATIRLDRNRDGEHFGAIATIGVGAAGGIWIGDAARRRVDVFDQTGRPVRVAVRDQDLGSGGAELVCAPPSWDCALAPTRDSVDQSIAVALLRVAAPSDSSSDALPLVAGRCTLPSGQVLVASDRLGGIFAMAGSTATPQRFGGQAMQLAGLRVAGLRAQRHRMELVTRTAALGALVILLVLLASARTTGVLKKPAN